MRIPERVAWRLYLSFSQNATRVRPLSSLHHQLDFPRTKFISPKDLLSTPLRHFLASSARSRFVFTRFPYSTQGGLGQGDGSPVGLKGVGGSGWSTEEVVNWSNAISIGRHLSGPLLAWMISQGMAKSALVGLVLAGGSDWLDGYMARRLCINSVLGSCITLIHWLIRS